MTDHAAPDETAVLTEVLAAIESVDGVRPAGPYGLGRFARPTGATERHAVDIGTEVIEIRVVATALPLPPLLEKVAAAVHAALTGTARTTALVRIIVAGLDAAAFDGTSGPTTDPP